MAGKNASQKDAFYAYYANKLRLPEAALRPVYDAELDGKKAPDEPFEIPDKMEVLFKYSYGGQSRFFREIFHNNRLLGSKCPKCGKVYCPPRRDCPLCYEPTAWVDLPGTGRVEAFTVQYFSTSVFVKKVPFLVAYVKLDGSDLVMMANIEMDDVGKAKPGMPVKVVFRPEKAGAITDIYFEPIEQ